MREDDIQKGQVNMTEEEKEEEERKREDGIRCQERKK